MRTEELRQGTLQRLTESWLGALSLSLAAMSNCLEHAVRANDRDAEASGNLIAGLQDPPSYPMHPAARSRMLRQVTLDMAKIAQCIRRFGQSTA